jgi:hypothetical protein
MITKAEAEAQFDKLKASIEAQLGNCPPDPPSEQRPVQLPFWPEPVRGGPNALLRSALFAGIHSKKRQILGTTPAAPDEEPEGVTIAAQNGIRIKFAGKQLNQYDADVFFEALHRARHHPLETECLFRGYDFLKAIGRTDQQLNYDDLHNSLTRLRDGRIEVECSINGREYTFVGGLVASYMREKTSRLYKVTFSKEIRALFAPACWTWLEWDERQALKGHPLAQWLHSYFSTHAEPYPVSVAFLHQKTGSKHTLLKNFRIDLKKALATLEKRLGWKTTWNGDLVTVTRPPSPSPARHLITKHAARNDKQKPKREGKGLTPASRVFPGMKKARI